VLVAGFVTASDFGTFRFLPPSFQAHSPSYATANMSILVGMPAISPEPRSPHSTSGLYELALTLGDISGSPALLKSTASIAGIRPSQLAIDEPLWSNLQRTQEWDTGPKRGIQIMAEGDPYRITLTDDPQSPIIYATTQGPTVAGAERVTTAFTRALSRFVTSTQNAAHTPTADRYRVRELTPIATQPGKASELYSFEVFVFLSVLVVWWGVVFALCRIVDELRSQREVKAWGRQRRFLNKASTRRPRRIAHRPSTTEH